MKFRIFAVFSITVVVGHCFFEVVRINTGCRGKFADRVAFLGKTELKSRARLLDLVSDFLIENLIGNAARLFAHRSTCDVARREFADKALAFLIDEHGASAAHCFGDNHGRAHHERRVKLDFLGIGHRSADFLRKHHAVTLTAGLV